MNVKSAADSAAKWARVTPDRQEDYEAGVRSPGKDWATETAAAESRYEDGIKASIARKAFGKGVKRAGTAKQMEATILKGIPRWPEGVRAGEDSYREGFGPYEDELRKISLPPRYPAGDPRNIERVKAVTTGLHKKKLAIA